MKLALSAKLEVLLAAKAEALGLSPQDALRMLAAAWVGGEARLVPAEVPQGSLSVPSPPPSSPSPSPSLDSPTPPSLPPPEQQNTCSAGGDLVLFPVPPGQEGKAEKKAKRDAEREVELAWRISETWDAFLFARECFYREHNGVRPSVEPKLSAVRQHIRDALLEHDRERLRPEDRERWAVESPVKAAGVGMFYDPWCCGTAQGNDARNGGRRYLEPDRPWRKQKGKTDPVLKFSELCFEVRDQDEARRK